MDTSALKPAALHILRVLADGNSHGYAVMRAVRDQSGGQIPLQTGSFYRHLSRLIADGLVDEAPARRAHDDPRRGTYYRLTARGRQRLTAERRRLAHLVAVLGTPGSRKGQT